MCAAMLHSCEASENEHKNTVCVNLITVYMNLYVTKNEQIQWLGGQIMTQDSRSKRRLQKISGNTPYYCTSERVFNTIELIYDDKRCSLLALNAKNYGF